MIKAIHELARWLAARHIPTDSLTVIFNFGDGHAATRFETTFMREDALTDQNLHVDGIKIFGIKVKLESPAHEPSL